MHAVSSERNKLGRSLETLWRSTGFRGSASNSFYGILEYTALPGVMILTAPCLIRELGTQQFGVWMLVTAIISSMGMLSTGFGAATVKYVASYRGRNDSAGVEHTVRSTLS